MSLEWKQSNVFLTNIRNKEQLKLRLRNLIKFLSTISTFRCCRVHSPISNVYAMLHAQPTFRAVTQKLFKWPLKDVYGFERNGNDYHVSEFVNAFFPAYFHSRDIIFHASCHHLSHTRNRTVFAIFYTHFLPAVCAGFMLHNLFDNGTIFSAWHDFSFFFYYKNVCR